MQRGTDDGGGSWEDEIDFAYEMEKILISMEKSHNAPEPSRVQYSSPEQYSTPQLNSRLGITLLSTLITSKFVHLKLQKKNISG